MLLKIMIVYMRFRSVGSVVWCPASRLTVSKTNQTNRAPTTAIEMSGFPVLSTITLIPKALFGNQCTGIYYNVWYGARVETDFQKTINAYLGPGYVRKGH